MSSTPVPVQGLALQLKARGLHAFLASSAITMGYLHGFFEEGYERLLLLAISAEGKVRMICPGLTETQARRCGIEDVRPWNDGQDPLALVRELAHDWALEEGTLAVDDDLPSARLLELQKLLPRAAFQAGQSVMAELMRKKSDEQLRLLGEAGRIADEAFHAVHGLIRIGMTEQEVTGLLLESMRRLGGVPAFCIAAAGANSAEPHHHSDGTVLREGDALILDFGCSVEGYNSDITRIVVLGHASPELREAYALVLKAHQAARNNIQPGVPCQEIDRAARRVIADAGYGPNFMHRTGHGIGMRGHEEPYITEGNDRPLEIGHCFSIEPGIYLPGRFGVRIENCVACTLDGHTSFNEEPAAEIIELR